MYLARHHAIVNFSGIDKVSSRDEAKRGGEGPPKKINKQASHKTKLDGSTHNIVDQIRPLGFW